MTDHEANLQPLWPSNKMYRFHSSGEVCTQFQEKQLYIFLAMLGVSYIGHSSMMHVYNLRKISCALTYLVSKGRLILYQLQSMHTV